MTIQAKAYIAIILALGTAATAIGIAGWQCASPLMFATYILAALVTSGWKVVLPGIQGTISANFLYVLIGVVELSLGETILIAVSSVLLQYLYRARSRAKLVQAAFNVANIAIAAFLAKSVYDSTILRLLAFEYPLRLAAAAIAYFFANTFPIAAAIALTEGKSLIRIWKECYVWSFAYYLVGAAAAGVFHQLSAAFGWQASLLVVPVIYLVYRSYHLYLSRLEAEKEQAEIERGHAEEMASLHLRTIEALALAIEAKDQTTHDHLRRVEVYCMEMANLLGLSEQERRALQAASLLHDIGKLAVPEHILSKPGKLTPEEFEKIKIHPVVGAEILERVCFPYPVAPVVRYHHERWDGNGYPEGLSGEQIPIGARILAAVDCLDALASERQYRRAIPLEKAMAIVASEAGRTYDPRVVELLQANYIEMESKARLGAARNANAIADLRVDRPVSPAAGFEASYDPSAPAPASFLDSIGAARQEAQLLAEISQQLVSSRSLQLMLDQLTLRLRLLIPFDAVALYLRRGQTLENAYAAGADSAVFRSLSIPLGQGISGWVAESAKPVRNGNPSVEPGYLNDPEVFSLHRSALVVPLEGSSGIIGTLALYHQAADAFLNDHLRILLAVASRLSLAIENGLRFQEAEDTALTDYLTGLPNARALFNRLSEETVDRSDRGECLTVFVADLDGFKAINDSFGHLAGNRVLRTVAATLLAQCREGDMVARMGGDEFVVVCPSMHQSGATEFCARLRTAVEKAGVAELGKPILSISVGSAVFPNDGIEPDQLLASADRQMYLDKTLSQQRRAGIWALSGVLASSESSLARSAAETLPCPDPARS